MPIRLTDDQAKALWKYVELSREDLSDRIRARLDRDRDLLLGKHWLTQGEGGLKEITANFIGAGVWIKHCAQTYQIPTFDVQPVPPEPPAFGEDHWSLLQEQRQGPQGFGAPPPPEPFPMPVGLPPGMQVPPPFPPPTNGPSPLMGGGPSVSGDMAMRMGGMNGSPPGSAGAPPMPMPAPPGMGGMGGMGAMPSPPLPPMPGMEGAGGAGAAPPGMEGAPLPPMPPPALGVPQRVLPILLSERVTRDFEESRGWRSVQGALYDRRWAGIGICMTGWHFGDEEPMDEAERAERGLEYQALAGDPGVDLDALDEAFDDIEDERVGEGAITLRISPYDFIADPQVDAFNWEDAEFLGRVYTVDKERLVREYKIKDPDGLRGSADLKTAGEPFITDPAERNRPLRKEHPFVVLVEVWFKKVWMPRAFTDDDGARYPKGYYPLRVTWAVDRQDEPLRAELWPYEMRDGRGARQYPFDLLVNRPVPGELKGQSDCEIAEEQQLALNHARSVEATWADWLARLKFMARRNSLDQKAKEALSSGIVGDLVEIEENPATSPIRPIEVGTMRPEVEQSGEHAMRDQNALTGVDEAAQGVATEGRRTATEIREIAAKSGARAAHDDMDLELFVSSIARKQWQLRLQFVKTGDPVTITLPKALGGRGMPTRMTLEQEHLLPARINVVSGSSKLQNQQEKLENKLNAIVMLNSNGLLATPMNPQGIVNSRVLVEGYLTSAGIDSGDPDLYNTSEFVQAALMQMQQMALSQQAAGQPGGGPSGAPPPAGPMGGPPAGPPQVGRPAGAPGTQPAGGFPQGSFDGTALANITRTAT